MPKPFVVRIFPKHQPAFKVECLNREAALREATRHLLSSEYAMVVDPDGNTIYRHSKPNLKRMRVMEPAR